MSLLDINNDAPMRPYINTGTLFDLATGDYRLGMKNDYILDGGLSTCLGITGRPQTYKSGIAGSLIARALTIHPEAEAFVYDTEGSVARGEDRYNDFVQKPVSDRINFFNTTNMSGTDFYQAFKDICDNKQKLRKDYLVESPFINLKTRKPYKVFIPTFVLVDSFSMMTGDATGDAYTKNDIDSTGLNTLFLKDGMFKTRIMRDLPIRASKIGVYGILTAHIGDKIELDPYSPTPKQMQYMKGNDRVKNVGSGFNFLTTGMLQTTKAEVMTDSNKSCLYPNKHSNNTDVNLVTTMAVRAKNNGAGNLVPYVFSQVQGLLSGVTDFQFLRDHKNYGLTAKGNNQQFYRQFSPYLYPDANLTRNNLRDTLAENYRINRALELTAQLCFIQNVWSTFRLPEVVNTPIDKFAELLTHNEKGMVDRILESTGVWSTSKQERERLTIIDTLHLLTSEIKK